MPPPLWRRLLRPAHLAALPVGKAACSDDDSDNPFKLGRALPPFEGRLSCKVAGQVWPPPLQFQAIPTALAPKKRGPKKKNLACNQCDPCRKRLRLKEPFSKSPCIGLSSFGLALPLPSLAPTASPAPAHSPVLGSRPRQQIAARILPDYRYLDRYLDNERPEFEYNQGDRNGPHQWRKWAWHLYGPPMLKRLRKYIKGLKIERWCNALAF